LITTLGLGALGFIVVLGTLVGLGDLGFIVGVFLATLLDFGEFS
jgi:hypothetical protein